MTIRSMTGYARQEGTTGEFSWAWEIKSVNGRGFDARFRVPSMVDGLEFEGRKRLATFVARGSVSANLEISREQGEALPQINERLFSRLLAIASEYQNHPGVAPAALDGLMGIRGVLGNEDNSLDSEAVESLRAALLGGLDQAAEALVIARESEGRALEKILGGLLQEIADLVSRAGELDCVRLEAIRDRFAAKVADLMPEGTPTDDGRIEQEIATLAVKADIREELDRLVAHLEGAQVLLGSDEAVGRKLDFLCQELNREANTLCSKSGDVKLTRLGLDLKALIDQFREQVQNVE